MDRLAELEVELEDAKLEYSDLEYRESVLEQHQLSLANAKTHRFIKPTRFSLYDLDDDDIEELFVGTESGSDFNILGFYDSQGTYIGFNGGGRSGMVYALSGTEIVYAGYASPVFSIINYTLDNSILSQTSSQDTQINPGYQTTSQISSELYSNSQDISSFIESDEVSNRLVELEYEVIPELEKKITEIKGK